MRTRTTLLVLVALLLCNLLPTSTSTATETHESKGKKRKVADGIIDKLVTDDKHVFWKTGNTNDSSPTTYTRRLDTPAFSGRQGTPTIHLCMNTTLFSSSSF